MKTLRSKARRLAASARRRGAALLLSLMILFVLVAIVFQLSIGTNTDARVARNDLTITNMDLAIESAFQEVFQLLISDAEAAAAGGEEGAAPEDGVPADPGAGDEGLDGEASEGGDEAVDSRRDEFMRPQRTEINGIQLRIVVQDEDSKYNVLNVANEDEDESAFAVEQLARVIDLFREDTEEDIDRNDAEDMANAIRDHILQRSDSILARPELLTDNEDREDVGLPLSLRELSVLDEFDLSHFRDFRDVNGNVVHSLNSVLTVWTSLTTASEVVPEGEEGQAGGGEGEEPEESEAAGTSTAENGGGFAVNINTAPPAVLKGLFDDRDVPQRFWDDVIEYRNLEEESEDGEDENEDPPLDENGEEIIERKIFENLEELSEIDDWERMEDEIRGLVQSRLRVTSDVFSVYVTARVATSNEDEFLTGGLGTPEEKWRQEMESGVALLRTVRAVVWRRSVGEEIQIVPIVRWEVLDYVPMEVLDFPEDDR